MLACMYVCMHKCMYVCGGVAALCVYVCVGGSIKNSSNKRQLEKQQFFHKTGEM